MKAREGERRGWGKAAGFNDCQTSFTDRCQVSHSSSHMTAPLTAMCVWYIEIYEYICVWSLVCVCVLISYSVPHITKMASIWQATEAGKLPSLEMAEWIKDKWLSTIYLAQRRWRSVSSNMCVCVYVCVCVHVCTRSALVFTFFGTVANEELHVFYHIPELQMCDRGIFILHHPPVIWQLYSSQQCYNRTEGKLWKARDFLKENFMNELCFYRSPSTCALIFNVDWSCEKSCGKTQQRLICSTEIL